MRLSLFEKDAHKLFEIGVVLKGIEGALEILAGFLFLFITSDFVTNVIASITKEELAEDSRDFIANFLVNWSQTITPATERFIAVFLLVHGIVNLILVLGILKKKLLAYQSAIAFFTIFIAYQLYRITYSHSVVLGAVIVFDIALILLIAHEYKHLRTKLEPGPPDIVL